ADELEGADRAAGRKEAQRGDDAHAQPSERGMNRKIGAFGADRILEPDVEEGLVPYDVHVVGEWRRVEVRYGRLVACERPVGLQRDAGVGKVRAFGEAGIGLAEVEVIGDPEGRSVLQERRDLIELEIAGRALRKVYIANGFQRDAEQ